MKPVLTAIAHGFVLGEMVGVVAVGVVVTVVVLAGGWILASFDRYQMRSKDGRRKIGS